MTTSTKDIINIIILVLIFAIIIQIYNYTYKNKYGDILSRKKLAEVPYEVKCAFEEPGCEEGDIDGWTLLHGVIFFIIGLIIPNKFLAVLIISVIWELVQPLLGNQPRYIINPLTNITGYAIGSLVRDTVNKSKFREKYTVLV